MAGTVMISKKLLDKLRVAFRRYGEKVLGDSDITIDFYPTQLEEYFGVLITSPKFEEMRYGERQNSIWDFLRTDAAGVTNEDLIYISQIATETEAVEFI